MTGTPYDIGEFSAGNNPLIAPEVVETGIQLQYKKSMIGRNLLGYKKIEKSVVSTVKEEDYKGDVRWLSENGGLPKMDFAFVKGTRTVQPYGVKFDVTREQQDDGLEDEIRQMIKNAGYAMSYFEDLRIFYQIINATGLNTIEATNPWDVATGDTVGDPVKDMGRMRKAISQATKGQKPDTFICSETLFGYMTQYDAIKSRLYNTQGKEGYVVTAELPTFMGMQVVIDDAIDPSDEGQALAFKKKDIGTWEERYAIETHSVPGYMVEKEQIAFIYSALAKGDANIKFPKLGCLITDLYTA